MLKSFKLRLEELSDRVVPSINTPTLPDSPTQVVVGENIEPVVAGEPIPSQSQPEKNILPDDIFFEDIFLVAQKKGKLNPAEVSILKDHLRVAASNKELTKPQQEELETYLERFQKFGLEVEGEKQLAQLNQIISILQKVTEKTGVKPVAENLKYIETMVNEIIKKVKVVKESEYENFKTVIGNAQNREQAQQRFEEVEAAFRKSWVEEHWIRYQAEMLQEKLEALKKK